MMVHGVKYHKNSILSGENARAIVRVMFLLIELNCELVRLMHIGGEYETIIIN